MCEQCCLDHLQIEICGTCALEVVKIRVSAPGKRRGGCVHLLFAVCSGGAGVVGMGVCVTPLPPRESRESQADSKFNVEPRDLIS